MGRLEKLVAMSFFPVAIAGSVGGAIFLLHQGVPLEGVTALTIFGSYVYLATLERFFPLHPEWSRSHGVQTLRWARPMPSSISARNP